MKKPKVPEGNEVSRASHRLRWENLKVFISFHCSCNEGNGFQTSGHVVFKISLWTKRGSICRPWLKTSYEVGAKDVFFMLPLLGPTREMCCKTNCFMYKAPCGRIIKNYPVNRRKWSGEAKKKFHFTNLLIRTWEWRSGKSKKQWARWKTFSFYDGHEAITVTVLWQPYHDESYKH